MTDQPIPFPEAVKGDERAEEIYLLGFRHASQLYQEETMRVGQMVQSHLDENYESQTAFHEDEESDDGQECPECGDEMQWNPAIGEYTCLKNHE